MVYETFGTAFVLSTRHRQTLLATRKARTMFFKTKRNPRKTTRQTLSTEQLEPKAMFSVSPVEPVVALDVGPVNQAGYDFQLKDVALVKTYCTGYCFADTDGFIKLGDIKGELKPTERVGEDGRSIVHPQYNLGEDGRMVIEPVFNVGKDSRMIVHPQYNVGGSADPGGDDVFMPKPNRLSGTAGPGGTSFLTGVNSLAQANQQPQIASVWTNGNATSMAPRHAAFASMRR